MTRALALFSLSLSLSLSLGCATTPLVGAIETPTLRPSPKAALRTPEYSLPFHTASIVGLAMLPPAEGERWRMVSGDLDGNLRFWADGKLLAAWPAHPGGLAALVVSRDGTLYTAGFEGRVREWPSAATTPARSFEFGRPITAMAVSDRHLALSDGDHVQLWTRVGEPQLEYAMLAHAFVTGLAVTADSSMVGAAELRESSMRAGLATHPLAKFEGRGLRAVGPEEAAHLRYLAARDLPGAVADYVEVWKPNGERRRKLVPRAPIDSDLGLLAHGDVVYREIYGTENASIIGRRLEDSAHVSLALVKPWALFSGKSEAQDPKALAGHLAVGDFVLGDRGEIIIVDHFPGWAKPPPKRGWRVGPQRELAIGYGYAALGDAAGNLAVLELAQPTELGWLNPAEERPELLGAAANQPWIATATLEPRTQYRLWSLAQGVHRAIRVEPPAAVFSKSQAEASNALELPMYPVELALDDELTTLATSLLSFSDPPQAAVRLLSPTDGSARVLTVAGIANPIEIALSPSASELLAWAPSYPGFRWTGPAWTPPAWTPASTPNPSGAPYVSADGRFSAHVSVLARTIVDRSSGAVLVAIERRPYTTDLGAELPAAIANDGTLAIVEPFGGGVVELIDVSGATRSIELPGAATSLAWVAARDAQQILIVGFQDGSIVRVDSEAETTQPVHAGAGGRVWALAPLGGRPGVFLELDERGLALHRLDDDAVVELHLGDAGTLARAADSPPTEPSGVDLIAIWRPGTATPVCAIFDGSRAGVVTPTNIRRLGPAQGPEFFDAFALGQPCPSQPAPAPIEPVALTEPQP